MYHAVIHLQEKRDTVFRILRVPAGVASISTCLRERSRKDDGAIDTMVSEALGELATGLRKEWV
jgi:hypothetical protein